jgi:MFS family permease
VLAGGAGLGIAFPALTSLTANAVAETDRGVAGAMQQLMNQLGAVVGSVVLSTVSLGGGSGRLGPLHQAFVVTTAVATCGGLTASRPLHGPRLTSVLCTLRDVLRPTVCSHVGRGDHHGCRTLSLR